MRTFQRQPPACPRCGWMAWLWGARAGPASHARRRGASGGRCHTQGCLRQNTTHVTASASYGRNQPNNTPLGPKLLYIHTRSGRQTISFLSLQSRKKTKTKTALSSSRHTCNPLSTLHLYPEERGSPKPCASKKTSKQLGRGSPPATAGALQGQQATTALLCPTHHVPALGTNFPPHVPPATAVAT